MAANIDDYMVVNGDIPLRPDPAILLAEELALYEPHAKINKPVPPGGQRLLTGQVVTEEEAAKAASALGLTADWVSRSKHAVMLAKWTAQFPTLDNLIGHAQIDINTLDKVITQCEMVMVDANIPLAEKLKWFQTIVSAVKTKGNLNAMVVKAKVMSEGVRQDIERAETRPSFAPPTSGPIQINVHQGGKVEVSEKEKAV